MTDTTVTSAIEAASLSQLVTQSGINSSRPDETAKIPSQVDAMIATANAQLELVTGQIQSLDEMSKRISDARGTKSAEKDRLHKVLVGLHDAKAAMAKP